MSNSSPKPVPIAVIIAWISVFDSTLLMRFFSELMIFPRSGRIACVMRSRACFAEPPAESPSTMKSSASVGILDRAVGELARQRRVLERALAARELARLPSGLAAREAATAFVMIWRASGALLLQELREPLVHRGLHETLDRRIAELRLRLPFELRVLELHGDHGRQPFADVLAFEVVLLLLQQALLARVAVERPRQRALEARTGACRPPSC